MYVYMCVHTMLCMYICMYTQWKDACMMLMYVCMHACMHVHRESESELRASERERERESPLQDRCTHVVHTLYLEGKHIINTHIHVHTPAPVFE